MGNYKPIKFQSTPGKVLPKNPDGVQGFVLRTVVTLCSIFFKILVVFDSQKKILVTNKFKSQKVFNTEIFLVTKIV